MKRLVAVRKKRESAISVRMEKIPLITQDASKESHILCTECEMYFSALESHFGLTVKSHVEKGIETKDFVLNKFEKIVGNEVRTATVYTCTRASPLMLQLFVESLLYRIHISSGDYAGYTFNEDLAESLRMNLLKFKSTKGSIVLEKCKNYKSDDLLLTRYMLFCPKSEIRLNTTITQSFLPTPDYIKILVGEYYFWIIADQLHSPFENCMYTPVKVLRLTNDQYQSIYDEILKNFFETTDFFLKGNDKKWFFDNP